MKFADTSLFPVVFVACGLGLAAVGVANIFLVRRRRAAAVVAFISASIAILIGWLGSVEAGTIVTGAILVLASIALFVRRPTFAKITSQAAMILRSRRVQWSAVGLSGLSLVLLGIASMDPSESAIDSRMLLHVNEVPWPAIRSSAVACSDCGSPIVLKSVAEKQNPRLLQTLEQQLKEDRQWKDLAIRETTASFDCNCHGFVFAGGRYWVDPDEVECILSENGYRPVSDAKVGDLVVYRLPNGEIVHSAIVRAIMDDGIPFVEGKWSWMGVYLHRVGDTGYGHDVTYYRTDRGGHRLAGLPGETTSTNSVRTD